MGEITRDDENAAFDKLRDRLERIHPTNCRDDDVMMPKLTQREVRAILQFYRRHV